MRWLFGCLSSQHCQRRALNSRATKIRYLREAGTTTKAFKGIQEALCCLCRHHKELRGLETGEKTADLDANNGPDKTGQEVSAPSPIIPHSRDRSPVRDDKPLFISQRLEIDKGVQTMGRREGTEIVESLVKASGRKAGVDRQGQRSSAEN